MNMYMRRRSKVNRNRQREIREMAEEIYFLSELYKEDDPQKKNDKTEVD